MPTIGFESTGFGGTLAGFNGGGTLSCTWSQLAWAAVTVGKAFPDEYAFGIFSTFERVHRLTMIYAYLFESVSGTIQKAETYIGADPSEKGNISYSLGMTLAKLFSEIYLDTPRLLHYSTYSANFNILTGPGNSRPDLIGLTASGDWIVFEAKGRSGALETGVLTSAKTQAEQVASINGVVPICRVGAAAYFAITGLRFAMDDPESKGHRRILDLTPKIFRERYDDSLEGLVEKTGRRSIRTVAGVEYRGARFDDADLFLGYSTQVRRAGRRQLDPSAYLGSDGLMVQLGKAWTPTKMRLQPQLR